MTAVAMDTGPRRTKVRRVLAAPAIALSGRVRERLLRLASECWGRMDYYHAEIAYKIANILFAADRESALGLFSLLMSEWRYAEAIDVLERYMRKGEDHEFCHAILANLHSRLGDDDKARTHLDALPSPSPATGYHLAHGNFHRHAGNLDLASAFFEEACRASLPTVKYLAMVHLGNNYIDQNREEDAISILEQAIALAPDLCEAYASLAKLKYYGAADHPHIDRLQSLLARDQTFALLDRIQAHFTLGEVFDHLSDHERAFVHFKNANDLKATAHVEPAGIDGGVAARIEVYDAEFLGRATRMAPSDQGEGLIFVVGMPRSGTTLTEQILASHPDVHGGGERRDIRKLAERLFLDLGSKRAYPHCVRLLDRDTLMRISRKHLDHVAKLLEPASGAGSGCRLRFVDKAPMNFLEVGLISVLFPGARIVHCMRDPLDTCLSCYFHNFGEILFSCKMDTLGAFYKQYAALMEHWHAVLPGKCHDLQYERLVEEPRRVIGDLLDDCGLPWDDRCLDFHVTKRVVLTPSTARSSGPFRTGPSGGGGTTKAIFKSSRTSWRTERQSDSRSHGRRLTGGTIPSRSASEGPSRPSPSLAPRAGKRPAPPCAQTGQEPTWSARMNCGEG